MPMTMIHHAHACEQPPACDRLPATSCAACVTYEAICCSLYLLLSSSAEKNLRHLPGTPELALFVTCSSHSVKEVSITAST